MTQELPVTPDPAFTNLTREEKDKLLAQFRQEAEERDRADMMRAERTRLEGEWEKLCPPIYRDEIDVTRLKNPDLSKVALVTGWTFRGEGMLLSGPTERGKTRCCWAALKRAHFQGYRIIALSGVQFANEASAAAYSPDATTKWMNRLIWPDILFIDDLAKRFTRSSGQLLFDLIEQRVSWKKPIIITTNVTSDQLTKLIDDPELANPLNRRLREFCNPITL